MNTDQAEKPYKVEVIADSTRKFYSNGLRFDTIAEAKSYAINLMSRWVLVEDWRVTIANGDVVCSMHTQ